jgi:urease accessory protein
VSGDGESGSSRVVSGVVTNAVSSVASSASDVEAKGWQASLRLSFVRAGERTVLGERVHEGPLRVQRPFYPEGPVCHVYVLHPPGGIVGGDELALDVTALPGAHALLTTPAATKLYRSSGARARQLQCLRAAEGACLEWLPQETIVWSGVQGELHTRIELAAGARFFGWELLCLGRPAAGERFESGRLIQRIELYVAGKPVLIERGDYLGQASIAQASKSASVLTAPWGLADQPVVGTLLCVSERITDELLTRARQAASEDPQVQASVTTFEGVLVTRVLGASTERARNTLERVWRALRPEVLGMQAEAPRIWLT